MRTPSGILFAPGIRFRDLDLDSAEQLADALGLRLNRWFLEPARILLDTSPFASGAIITCFVDAAAELEGVDFISWFKSAVPDSAQRDPRRTRKTIADSVY